MKNVQVLNHFWQRLSAAKQAVLFLDYDGTLAPFCAERDQRKPYDGIREILTAIRHDTTPNKQIDFLDQWHNHAPRKALNS